MLLRYGAQRSELAWFELLVGAPIVVTGEEDVPPAQRRCVRQNECRLGIRSETLKVQNFPFLEGHPYVTTEQKRRMKAVKSFWKR